MLSRHADGAPLLPAATLAAFRNDFICTKLKSEVCGFVFEVQNTPAARQTLAASKQGTNERAEPPPT